MADTSAEDLRALLPAALRDRVTTGPKVKIGEVVRQPGPVPGPEDQVVCRFGRRYSTAGADIGAPEAWDFTPASRPCHRRARRRRRLVALIAALAAFQDAARMPGGFIAASASSTPQR
jgi:hypothetical protein